MLLPLMNIDIGEQVIDLFRYIKPVLFSFNFVPNKIVFFSSDDIFDPIANPNYKVSILA